MASKNVVGGGRGNPGGTVYKKPSSSVKVVPPSTDAARASTNVKSAIRASNAKSGASARVGAAQVPKATKPAKVIKIPAKDIVLKGRVLSAKEARIIKKQKP